MTGGRSCNFFQKKYKTSPQKPPFFGHGHRRVCVSDSNVEAADFFRLQLHAPPCKRFLHSVVALWLQNAKDQQLDAAAVRGQEWFECCEWKINARRKKKRRKDAGVGLPVAIPGFISLHSKFEAKRLQITCQLLKVHGPHPQSQPL